jgi:hypothetical protein
LISQIFRNALEELSIRADFSLCQKKVMNEISAAKENFEEEYVALSAQVVGPKKLGGRPRPLGCTLTHCSVVDCIG